MQKAPQSAALWNRARTSRRRGSPRRRVAPTRRARPRATKPPRAAKPGPPRPRKEAKAAKPKRKANNPRAHSKSAKILEMIGRAKGATLAEIMKATDWQAHSVRGFLSTSAKKHGMKIESVKDEAGERSYRINR